MLRQMASVLVSLFLVFGAAHAQDGSGVSSETTGQRTSVDLLLDVIEDDAARTELIERLRGADTVSPDAPGDVIVETLSDGTAPPEDASFGRRIALVTQQAAEDVAGWGLRFWEQLTRAPEVFGGLSGGEAGVLAEALQDLALVIAGTVVVFFVLRWLGKSLYANMSASARDGGVARTAMLFTASAVIDAVIVILAWGAGYALAILALGEFGQIGIRQTLYLNAFLLVEMAKVAVRLVLSPSATSLRPLPIGDRAASYLVLADQPDRRGGGLRPASGGADHQQQCLVRGGARGLGADRGAGSGFRDLAGAAQSQGGHRLVAGPQPRRAVPDTGMCRGSRGRSPGWPMLQQPRRARGTLAFLARRWHWPALVYLLAMFVLVVMRPGDAMFQTFLASGQVLVVGLLGFAASGFISRALTSGVILPARGVGPCAPAAGAAQCLRAQGAGRAAPA